MFTVLFIVLMLGIAIVLWLKKHTPITLQNNNMVINKTSLSYLVKGFSLGILNPQLLPFWIVVQVYFNSTQLLQLKTEVDKLSYILGAGLGALMLLVSLIALVIKYKTKVIILLNNKYYYKVLAILFIGIALQQIITLMYKN